MKKRLNLGILPQGLTSFFGVIIFLTDTAEIAVEPLHKGV
jgi:hypothetical protein